MGKKRMIAIAMTLCMLFSVLTPQNTWGGEQAKEAATDEVVGEVDATTYGADPTGVEDSAQAIVDAIAAAKKVDGPVKINFPKGEYHIYPDTIEARELYISNTVGINSSYKMKKIGFLFEDMQDVTVEGNGSLFIFHGKMTTYATINSENIKFQNFSFDFRTPTVVDITVQSIDRSAKKAVIYVPGCYDYSISGTTVTWKSDVSPYTGQPYWTDTNKMDYTQKHSAKTGLTWRGDTGVCPIFANVTAIKEIEDHRLEFTYSNLNNEMEEGLCCQMRRTTRDHAGMFFWKSKDVTLQNVNVHFLHGFGIVGQHTENVTLDNVIFEAPEGSGRTTVGYADFLQMSGCKGKVTIQNCSFANPHDDPINVHGTFNDVVEKIADNKFKVRYMHGETAGFPNYFVGDEVEFVTKGNLIAVPDSVATVTAVEGPTGESGASASGSGSLTDIIITLDRDLPNIAANTHVVENITYTPEVLIQNNVFKETPTRGILVTTRRKVEIKNNEFDGMGMASIYISNDAQDWRESGAVKDVTIEGNVFYRPTTGAAAIYINPTNPTVSTDATVHENIVIRDNDFYMQNGEVLNAKSVNGISFTNNRIYRYEPKVTVTIAGSGKVNLKVGDTESLTASAHAEGNYNSNLYAFNGCKNVTISGNTYDGGLKLGGSKSNMADSDIKNADGIAIGGSATTLPVTGSVAYESSDQTVLTVNERGQVTAVGEGTAKVRAYTVTGGRKFVSEWRTFTVSSEDVSDASLSVSTEDNIRVTTEYNKTIQYSATDAEGQPVSEVTWSVVNAHTHGETACATIDQNGLLTTKSDGAVGIIASTADGLEAREVLVINKGEKVLSNAVAIYDNDAQKYGEDPAKWSITEDNAIEITAQGDGIFKEQKTKNIFMTKDAFSKDNMTAEIKLTGDTVNSWDEAGMLIGYDVDNYVSIGRKYRADDEKNPKKKITMVKELSQKAEGEHWKDYDNSNALYLKLEKNRTTIKGYYKAYTDTEWTQFISQNSDDGQGDFLNGEFDFSGQIDQDIKVGFFAARSGTKYVFSDLTVTEDGGEPQSIPLAFDNKAPTVKNVSCTYANGNLTTDTGEFSDLNEGDTEGESIIKWMISDEENGIYKFVPEMLHEKKVNVPASWAGKYVKSLIIPQDNHGLYGAPVESEPVLVGEDAATQPTSIAISVDKRVTAVGDENISYNAVIEPDNAPTVVSWSVVDAVTKNATACAEIDANGSLTAKSNGVVEVIARTSNGLEARELLVITEDERVLAHHIKIDGEEEKDQWSLSADGVVEANTVDGGLWEGGNEKKVKNWFSYALDNAQNVTATIKLQGRTQAAYQEAGLVFFIDNTKYVFVGRKHGASSPTIRLVTYTGSGKANEDNATASDVKDNPVYLKLVKEGDSFTAFYSTDKTNWQSVGSAVTNATLGSQFKVGFYAGKPRTTQTRTAFQFSELEINGENIPLTSMNQPPVVSNVAGSYDEQTKAVEPTYTFTDTNEDTEGTSLIRWMASDQEDGPFELVEDVSDLTGKWAKAVVIPQDFHGLYGEPVIAEKPVHVGEIAATAILSADSALRSASITGAGNFATFSSGTKYYVTTADKEQTSVTASFAVKDAGVAEGKEAATVEVMLNGKSYAKDQSSVSNLSLPLVSGINVIRAIVTAEDGKTKTEYRFAIIRTGDFECKASSILLDGTALNGFNADTMEYEYTTQKNATQLDVQAIASSNLAGVKIAANGKLTEGNSQTVSLEEPGRNNVTIYITPETKYPQSRYQISVFVPSDANADLKALSFESGVVLNHRFDAKKTSYTGMVTAKTTKLSLTADESNAKIELTANGETIGQPGTGKLEQNISFTKGSNRIQVKVTSPDGNTTKTYALKLTGVGEVELSSLQYNSNSTVGWGTIHKNESTGGNPISLRAEDGTIKTYESGIGGHATMNLYYNIDPSYTKFVSWIGIDLEKGTTSNAASVKCSIYLDDTAVWTSGDAEMGTSTPAKQAQVDLGSAKIIRINADKGRSDDSDHVSLGDAKFLTELSGDDVATFYDVEYCADPADAATITATAGTGANASSGEGYIRVAAGSDVTLTAEKEGDTDLSFAGWYDEAGKQLSSELSYTVSGLQADAVCIARLKTQAQIDLEKACGELESLIKDMESRHTEEELRQYTTDSITAYRASLKAAKDALADRAKTKETIDQAKNDLVNGESALTNCTCEIEELTVSDQTVSMEAGQTTATVRLEPQVKVVGSCLFSSHPESNSVTYSYKVTDAGKTGAAVNESGPVGIVTVQQAGTATIEVKAELASGTAEKRSKTKTVTIRVTKPATVTFNANGGVFGSSQSSISAFADGSGHVSAPTSIPVKPGYAFKGWRKEDSSVYNFETDTVDEDLTLIAYWTEREASVRLNSTKDFSIGSYSNTASGENYRILIVHRENNTGEIGENHLLGKANTKPSDNKIALLQFDLSGYTAKEGKKLESVMLRLCMAGSNGTLTDDQLVVYAIPAESGITDLTKAPSEQGVTLGARETLPASWSWDAVKAVLDKWNPGTGKTKEFVMAGNSNPYSYTGATVNMDIRNKADAALDKTAYYVDITETVQKALDAGTKNLILAVNEMKNKEHYFISSIGANGQGTTTKYDNADATMAPSLQFFYEGDKGEKCSCVLGDIAIDSELTLTTGASADLAPNAAIQLFGCTQHTSADKSRITYKYEVTNGNAVSVNEAGKVTAGSKKGAAEIKITATLDNDSTKTKETLVRVTVQRDPASEERLSSIQPDQDFCIKGYSGDRNKSFTGSDRPVLVVRNQSFADETLGYVGEGMLLSGKTPDDPSMSLLQFDFSDMRDEEKDALAAAKLRLYLAGSRDSSTGNTLRAAVVPAESGLTDISDKTSWNAVSGAVSDWLSDSAHRFTPAGEGESQPYDTGSDKDMEHFELDKPPVSVEIDITGAVKAALASGSAGKFILAINDTKGAQHYFVRSNGISTIEGAAEDMAPTILFTYEDDPVITPGGPTAATEAEIASLQSAVNTAKEKDLSGYTEESANAYKDAIKAAEDILKKTNPTKQEVEDARRALEEAVLIEKEPDTATEAEIASLQAAVDAAKEKDLSSYTEESANAYKDAIKAAEDILKKTNPTKQEVEDARRALEEAVLIEQKPDTSLLQAAVDAAEKKDLSSYSADSVKLYNEALAAAQKVLSNKNATKQEIEKALADLREAEKKLTALASNTASAVPEVGKIFVVGGYTYRVTKSDAANGEVALNKAPNKKTLIIPGAVSYSGYTFKVTSIDQKACQNMKKVKGVIIGENIKSIEGKAFLKCKKLKTITFKCETAPVIKKQAFKKIKANCKVIVPKKMKAAQLKKLKKSLKAAGVKRASYKKK